MDENGETIFNKTITDSLKKNLSYREIFKIQVIMELNKKIIKDLDKTSFQIRNSIILDKKDKIVNEDYHSNHIPVLTIGTTTFHHIYKKGLYIIAVSQKNIESFYIWDYLHFLYDILNQLNLLQSIMLNSNLLRLIVVVNFTLTDLGVPKKETMDIDVIKKFLLQSY